MVPGIQTRKTLKKEEMKMLGDFIQLALVISAWRNGWRFRALIPPAINYGVAFLVGIICGIVSNATGAPGQALLDKSIGIIFLTTIASIIALGIMTARKPRQRREQALPKALVDESETERDVQYA